MPACRTCGVDVETAYQQIDTARRKLELVQEKVTLDQELLKQDKRNFKRRLQAAKAAANIGKPDEDDDDVVMKDSIATRAAAKLHSANSPTNKRLPLTQVVKDLSQQWGTQSAFDLASQTTKGDGSA